MSWEHRATIFMKAAELISGPYRAEINSATMLAQSKNAFQAEIDAARRTNIAQQKEPFERASFASDILRGVPSSQISYTQAPDPSTFQQIAGLGIAGLGAIGGISGLRV